MFGANSKAEMPPPQPFVESVKLPGKVPSAPKDLHGAWQFNYTQDYAKLAVGRTDLIVAIVLTLREDGSYEFKYSARWASPDGRSVTNGVTAQETGSFSLSGEVLLLEPATTQHSEIRYNRVIKQQAIANENHVLLAHVGKEQLHVAGRCAKYQVDPVCRTSKNVWYTFAPQLGLSVSKH
jgi:hypothetical protein